MNRIEIQSEIPGVVGKRIKRIKIITENKDIYLSFAVEKIPQNTECWIEVLEGVLGFLKAPSVRDRRSL